MLDKIYQRLAHKDFDNSISGIYPGFYLREPAIVQVLVGKPTYVKFFINSGGVQTPDHIIPSAVEILIEVNQ